MLTYGNNIVISGIYNFVDDPNAGAVGTINLGPIVPQNNNQYITITNISVVAIDTLTSADSTATLAFGLKTGVYYPPSQHELYGNLPTGLMGVNLIDAFNDNVDAQGNFQPLQGNISPANPLKMGYYGIGWYVYMSIGTEALTGGKLQININANVTSL